MLVFAAAAADSRGYFGEQRGEATSRWSRFTVLRAAQPAWTPTNHTPAPTGHAWDFNWDKYVPLQVLSFDWLFEPSQYCYIPHISTFPLF